MAKDKKSFLLYTDLIHTVSQLPDDKAGALFKHILEYVNDMDPISDDIIINIAFEPIKQSLKRDLEKWEKKATQFSEAGKASAKARRLINKTQLYVLRFYNDFEEFIKVGITDNSVSRRYSSKGEGNHKLEYKFEVEHQIFAEDLKDISVLELENIINDKFSKYRYRPKKSFSGHSECFNINSLNEIIHYLTTFNDVQRRSTTFNDVENSSTTFNDVENSSTKSTVSVNDSVIVSDSVNVNDFTSKKEVKEKPLKSPSRRKPPQKKMDLKFPYSSDEFKNTWKVLAEMPKWKKKIEHSLQISLDKLGKYEEAFAIELMERAISGNYQGVVFPDTDEAYQKWKKGHKKESVDLNKNVNSLWSSRK